jgi:subfamily B ATP-binding cassette protein HlyB/CyaB
MDETTALARMLAYSPLLTLVVVGALSCYTVLAVLVTPILQARLHERFARGAENHAFLVEVVKGVETVKAMAVEPALQCRWDENLAAGGAVAAAPGRHASGRHAP